LTLINDMLLCPSMDFVNKFFLSFLPIFVAFDALGIIPIFVTLTSTLDASQRRKVTHKSMLTAGLIGLIFIFAGQGIFSFLGITITDFKIAGGLILLLLSVHDLLAEPADSRRPASHTIGIVPLGMPLILGPAALTATLSSSSLYGIPITLGSFLLNLAIIWLVLAFSGKITKLIGEGASMAISKVMNLLLSAIAIMLIRSGVISIIQFLQGEIAKIP